VQPGYKLEKTSRHSKTAASASVEQAEDSLRALTRRIQAILQTIPDIIAEVDENRVYTWVNNAGLKFFGDQVLGKEAACYFVDEQDTYAAVKPLFGGDADTRYVESWQRREDGESRLLAWWCRSLKDDSGKVIGALSTGRDITERWRAETIRDARLRLLEQAPTSTVQEFLHAALRELELLTTSRIGFCKSLQAGQDAFSSESWAALDTDDSCDIEAKELHHMISEPGVWADCLRERRPLIYNDYQAIPNRKDTPPGHAVLQRLLTVPVFRGDEIVAVFVLANKATDYTAQDLETVSGFSDLAWDTAARKSVESALQDSDNRNRRLFDSSPDSVVLSEPGGHFLDCNQTAIATYGYSREEFLQMTYRDLAALDLRDQAGRHVGETLERGGTVFEWRHRRKDGSELPVEIRTAPFMAQGRQRIMATIRDLTASKAAEEALRSSEREFRALFEAAPVGIGVADLDGRLLAFNDAMLGPGGYSREDILDVGNVAALYYDPEDRQAALALFHAEGSLHQYETRFRRKDGTPYDVWLSLTHTTFSGLPCIQAIVEDGTEKKRAEEERERLQTQLRQAAKMESIGRLAGGVAHDFNNMLAVILGHADLALEQLDPQDRLHEDLLEIRKAANRSATITQQLLAFARRQVVAPKVIDLNKSVEGMTNMLRRLIGEQVELLWIPGKRLGRVRIDPAQLDQVLVNLCLNARDAIVDTGRVTIKTADVLLDEDYCADHEGCAPGHYVLLSVRDNGTGMSPEAQEHLFEPFFTTKDTGKGTGLGLATAYGILAQNKGFIDIDTQQHLGTEVRIYLPRVDAVATPEDPEIARSTSPRGVETLLLVEDEPSVLRLTARILTELNYTVLTARTPSEALRIAEEHPTAIHLTVTDVVMPQMNGRELADRLRALRPQLKTLYVSGYTDEILRAGSEIREGVNFLQKPFAPQSLAAAVRALLDRA
jgi:two-component system cell cycle sensor histidine kinase/response regulator CckA